MIDDKNYFPVRFYCQKFSIKRGEFKIKPKLKFFCVHRRTLLTIIPERSAFHSAFLKFPIFFILQRKQIFFSLNLSCCIRQSL